MKVLIPLDGSKYAESVLETVTQLVDLKTGEMEVHLIKVVDPGKAHTTWRRPPPPGEEVTAMWYAPGAGTGVMPPRFGAGLAVEWKDQALDRIHNEAAEYLEGIARRFFPEIARTTVIFGHDPAEEILAYARHEKVNLIAMSTHGRTGLVWLLMGGVTSRVLNARLAPVLLVRPDGLNGKAEETAASNEPDGAEE